jgi:hypothetical protein
MLVPNKRVEFADVSQLQQGSVFHLQTKLDNFWWVISKIQNSVFNEIGL